MILAATGCGRKSTSPVAGEPSAQSPSASTPTQSPSISASPNPVQSPAGIQRPAFDLSRLENSVQPAVFWITVFDSSGKLLRSETAFFISGDGRFVTTAHAIRDGVNAVAKMADGRIYNVIGILAASTALDLAVLEADVKYVPFLKLNATPDVETEGRVAIVGSGLAGSDGAPRELAISKRQAEELDIAGTISSSSTGSPIVTENGEVVGVVTSAGEKSTIRTSGAVDSLLAAIASETKPRWPEVAETAVTPTPSAHPTVKPRLVYAPAPAFPRGMSQRGGSLTGRFRLTFNAKGNVTNVQVINSTGNPYFDSAAMEGLRQWRSAPGQEWVATVPVTFQGR
jgi:TonB family protein